MFGFYAVFVLIVLGANESYAVKDDKRIYVADRASKFVTRYTSIKTSI